jgi:hypothetical protein
MRLDRTPIIHPVTITGAQGLLRGPAVVDYPPEEDSIATDDEGKFSYCCVAPGDWQVVAEFTPGNVPGQVGATSVDVTKDIEGLKIQLSQSLDLNVTIEWAGELGSAAPKYGSVMPVFLQWQNLSDVIITESSRWRSGGSRQRLRLRAGIPTASGNL